MFRRIDDNMLVSGQLSPDEVSLAAQQGVTTIVNNRPDDEAPGQPSSADIARAAAAAGVDYRHIPVAGGFSPEKVEAMAEVLRTTQGPILAFCAAGTRSTYLWALASARAGVETDEILAKAAAAGYDLTPLKPYL